MNKFLFPLLDGFFLIRPVVLIPVWGFGLFGYFKGCKGTIASIPAMWRTTDPMTFVWIMIFSLSVGCVYVLNQIADIEVDKKNSGLPLLANGIVSRRVAYMTAGLTSLSSIFLSLYGNHPAIALFSIASIGIGVLYSFRPFYFSGRPFLDFLTNAAGFGIIAFGTGWHLAGRKMADPTFLSAAMPYFLLMCAGAISSTIPDIKGDSEGEKLTTAVVLGEKKAHYLATVFVIAALFYSLIARDGIASICAIAALPLYLLHTIHPRKIFAESTYKIGGVFCMAMASCIAPQFLLCSSTVAVLTWMYFRYRHGVAYPSLVPRGKSMFVSGGKKQTMTRSFLIVFSLLIFFHHASAFSFSEFQLQYAGRGISAILDCRYDLALSLTDSVINADSADALAPILRLTAIGLRNIDFDTLLDTAAFFSTYRLAENRIAACEKAQGGPSSYSKMLFGFCKGFNAAFYLREKSYFAAMRNGFKALSLLDESRRLDTTNVEPLFLLGLYEYAKSELRRRLWWVLFWYPGSKKNGIARLWTCSKNGVLTGEAAIFGLADIYVREKRPDDCAPLMERLERDFPRSRFTLWAKAKYLESRRLFYEAGLSYELLAESYAAEPYGKFNALVARNLQAHMLFQSGQKKDAVDSCRAILREPSDEKTAPIFKDTKKLLNLINDEDEQ